MQNYNHTAKPSCSQWHNATCVFHLSSHIRPPRTVLQFAPNHICTLDYPHSPSRSLPVAHWLSPDSGGAPRQQSWGSPGTIGVSPSRHLDNGMGFSQACGQGSFPGACAACQPRGCWVRAGENLHPVDRQVLNYVCSYFGWKCVAEHMKRLPAQCMWPLRA